MNEINCGIIRDLLPLYNDAVCSEESKQAVEEHLGHCPCCQSEFEKIRKTLSLENTQASKNIDEGESVISFARFMKQNKEKAYRKGFSIGLIIAVAVTAIAFYLLPLLIKDTGSGMFILLLVLPAVCFASALLCGLTAGIQWLYSVLIAILFIPTIFVYFNSTAAVYVAIYGVISFIGNMIGGLIYKYLLKKAK